MRHHAERRRRDVVLRLPSARRHWLSWGIVGLLSLAGAGLWWWPIPLWLPAVATVESASDATLLHVPWPVKHLVVPAEGDLVRLRPVADADAERVAECPVAGVSAVGAEAVVTIRCQGLGSGMGGTDAGALRPNIEISCGPQGLGTLLPMVGARFARNCRGEDPRS